jgi:hypothetical protein
LRLADFYQWGQAGEEPRPPSEAGAALLALIDRDLFEGFWLDGPWFAPLMDQGEGVKAPSRLCLAAKDAVILAPTRHDADHWTGFLIACASASGEVREFGSEDGEVVVNLRVPADVASDFGGCRAGAVLAIEGRENSG